MEKDEKYWSQKIAEYQSSGKSLGLWCRENKIKRHRLKEWLNNAEKPTCKDLIPKWSEVEVIDNETVPDPQCEITVKYNNMEILLPLTALKSVLEVVKNID